MKKKVGIMSMQRIRNYGSYLQAYALSNIIKKLGHDVEFVDFKIGNCLTTNPNHITVDDMPEDYKDKYYKQKDFETNLFINKFLVELGVDKRNERPNLDTLVIGSDEVFNCLQFNPDVGYALELFGKDNNAKRVISYAASCGATTYENLVHHQKDKEVSKLLNKFNAISVRDNNSKNFVEKLTNITPVNHLDPVLVYDFSNDLKDVKIDIDNYIIVYAYPHTLSDEICNKISKFAKKNNKKIVTIGSHQKCTDIFIPAHPLEVFKYFENADLVITNTFHGTIFSIKSHTPFVTSICSGFNNQKLYDLLERLNFLDRKIDSYDDIEKIYANPIDFSNVDEKLKTENLRTIEYLKNNI